MPISRRFAAVAACLVLSAGSLAFAADPAPAADPAKLVDALKGKDLPARLEAARGAKSVQDERLVAPLVSLLSDEDVSLRQAAIDALGSRTGPEERKKAASALASHLPRAAKKPNSDIEVIATAQALGALAQPSSLDALMAGMELDTPPDIVEARLMAVAQIPTADAIDSLITFLAKQGRGKNGPQREACRSALREATGENFGNEPDNWRSWWKDAKKTFDFEAAARRRADEKEKKAETEERKRERKEKKEGGEKK